MPFKSDKQRRWAHTATGERALGGPAKVAEWDKASKGMDLPETAPAAPRGPRKFRRNSLTRVPVDAFKD